MSNFWWGIVGMAVAVVFCKTRWGDALTTWLAGRIDAAAAWLERK